LLLRLLFDSDYIFARLEFVSLNMLKLFLKTAELSKILKNLVLLTELASFASARRGALLLLPARHGAFLAKPAPHQLSSRWLQVKQHRTWAF
jgi:hypothetical protein